MNLILRGVVLILWALFLTACQAPLPKSSMDKGPTKSLSQKADEIYALALKENSYRMLDRARYLYEQALLAAPASVSLQYKTYLVYYRLIILGEQKHHSSAKAIYASLPSSLKKELAPPSYAKLILARRIGVRDEPYFKSLMQDVVAE
ncbi:MAG: hypothetical protein MI976_18345, partial [Pseudomonadales bacterium]|nr:hypothetical protein [Pseudomonadales bacterium]